MSFNEVEFNRLEPPCIHRRMELGLVPCDKGQKVLAYDCAIFGRCTADPKHIAGDLKIKTCRFCEKRLDPHFGPVQKQQTPTWAVGLTTFLGRKDTTLPRTLSSLARAGWEEPTVFVDGGTLKDWSDFSLPVRIHPKTHAYGNWWLGMQELYIRNPTADRYLMVQDDVIFVRGLRDYLNVARWPGKGYLNLYTFPQNGKLAKGEGFFRASTEHRGLGALALVFDQVSIVELLSSKHMIEKFRPVHVETGASKAKPWRATKAIDGGVVEAMNQIGMSEWCHMPSLVQHIGGKSNGEKSSIGNGSNPDAPSFPGEDYDARNLLKC